MNNIHIGANGSMELRHMRLLLAVKEEGTLTRAARRLHLTQSALSHQLRELEDRLGVALFHRLNRRMVLTPVGERMWSSAGTIMGEVARTELDVRRMIDGDSGSLRISTECYTSYHWLPNLMAAYRRDFPNVELQIKAEATRRPLQFLMDGELDIAITSANARRRTDPALSHQWLFEDELLAIVAPDHPFAKRAYVVPRDFATENVLTYTLSPEQIGFFRRVLAPAGVTPKRITRIELTEGIVEMARANLGIAVMARWAIEPAMKAGGICAVPITKRGIRRHWFATTIREQRPPGHLRAFVEHLSAAAQGTRGLGGAARR
jgi:LysR family transcriptional regulator for metE and metH